QGGDDDFDAEGGDDVMVAGPGIEKSAGASGWDWLTGIGDPQAQNADLNLPIVEQQAPVVETRDKFNEIEALSGYKFNDILRGDDVVPTDVGGGGFIGCDALDASGVARIAGLDALVPAAIRTVDSAPIIAASATHHCLLSGLVWGAGNILIGGSGNDLIEGRGGDDIIDGDRYLNVRISLRTNPADASSEIGSTDLMEHAALTGDFGPGTTPTMTLQQAVFAGLVDPGNLVAVRELLSNPATTDVDTALFSGAVDEYTITANANGSVTVDHNGGIDGIDTLWNMERATFTDGTVVLPVAGANSPAAGSPAIDDTTPTAGAALTADTSGITDADGLVGVTFSFQWLADGSEITGATTSTFTPTAAEVGKQLSVRISFTDNGGFDESRTSALTGAVAAAPAPVASVSPATLTFASQNVGTTSASQAITLTNTGNANLVVPALGVTIGGTNATQFAQTNNCATVAAGATCTINVTFSPSGTAGGRSAIVSIAHNAAGSPSSVSLSGTAAVPATPVASVSPTSLAFGNQALNTTSAARTVTVTNNGGANLVISATALGGTNANQFARTTTCATVAPGASCTINVTFRPTTAGAKTASLSITHNAAGSPSTVALTGTGVSVATVSAGALNFGATRINTTRTSTITVTNTGTAALTISSVATSGAPFTATLGTCTGSIAAGRTCRVNVTFAPTAIQAYTGTLTITSNANNNPTVVALSGNGRR
ncbi:MAG TPA: choice-of-anchor D domain-containing protein, partial [Ilumatobacteraceae bacterium]|nr:choice-of-anchor D domain-containing protein [Ilumatobacteraceae bacterium]